LIREQLESQIPLRFTQQHTENGTYYPTSSSNYQPTKKWSGGGDPVVQSMVCYVVINLNVFQICLGLKQELLAWKPVFNPLLLKLLCLIRIGNYHDTWLQC